jgi:WhiB family redox-sensing transcriptional regulator
VITRSALTFSPGAAGPLLARHDWRDDALCAQMPPEIFFPTDEEDPALTAQAKGVCGFCVSRPDCLAFAVAERIAYGIWGGTTPDERSAIPAPPPARCRKDRHLRTARNTGARGRCLDCKREYEIARRAADGSGAYHSRSTRIVRRVAA